MTNRLQPVQRFEDFDAFVSQDSDKGGFRARVVHWLQTYWRLWVAALLVLVALLLSSCASPVTQTLNFADAVWQDGEQAIYTVTTDDQEFAGTATFDVTRGTQGDPEGWTLRRDLQALGDQEIVVAEMAAAGYRPAASILVRINRNGAEQVVARYDGGQVEMDLVTRQNVATKQSDSIPSDAREQRTLPLIVRALPLADGYATQLNSYLPVTGRLERVTVSVRGRELLDVPAGSFDAWQVRLQTNDARSTLWIGVEPPHPLLMYEDDLANATYELQSFRPAAP